MSEKEPFGFNFWLGWIVWCALSFLIAAMVWTFVIHFIFGEIRGSELTLVWCVSVFGSWFLLLVPFMRKKERIWKRLNWDEEKALDIWLPTMTLFIGVLILSALFWSQVYRQSILDESRHGLDLAWAKAVFSSWLIVLLPFLVWMYKKADQIYKAALKRQAMPQPIFRTTFVERSKRLLPSAVTERIRLVSPTLEKGHVVDLILRDSRRIENVFIFNRSEILGIYDREQFDFTAHDVAHIEAVEVEKRSLNEESKWLRLDGKG